MAARELNQIRSTVAMEMSLDELEERLELQQVLGHPPVDTESVWACSPVHVCETRCDGELCVEYACTDYCWCDGWECTGGGYCNPVHETSYEEEP